MYKSKSEIITAPDKKLWRELPFGADGLMISGDGHGHVNQYWKLLQNFKGNSINVGDWGFSKEHLWHLNNIDSSRHKILFGNHEDYDFLYERHSLSNWSWNAKDSIMTIRGAFSIDKDVYHKGKPRIEGYDWWANEQMNYDEMQQCVDFYIEHKPKIVISHDCPTEVALALFGNSDKSLTSNGLQIMFETHQPDIHIFGHWHRRRDEKINGTRFVCLEELGTIVL